METFEDRGWAGREPAGSVNASGEPLGSAWMPVAMTDELRHPGDYRSRDLAGFSVIVVRDGEQASVLRNLCPHERLPMLERNTAGRAPVLVCPWHNWAFSLDGKFRPARIAGRLGDLAAGKRSGDRPYLEALACAELDGIIWSAAESPQHHPPRLERPFRCSTPPARLKVGLPWAELCERLTSHSEQRLGPNCHLLDSGERVGGRLVAVVKPSGPTDSELMSWVDSTDIPPVSRASQAAHLRRLVEPA